MKVLFASILFSGVAYSTEYDSDYREVDRYPSCVSWCKTQSLMKDCVSYIDREDKFYCKQAIQQEYYFCEKQCRDEYGR